MAPRAGHFRLESGHHGDLWLDLDRLFVRPAALGRFVAELARRLVGHGVQAVCGPSSGGAFLAQAVAFELEAQFFYAERFISLPDRVRYRIPDGLRPLVRGKRVAVVDDVVNAGSAVRATVADLRACGARPVAVGGCSSWGTHVRRSDCRSRAWRVCGATCGCRPTARCVRPACLWRARSSHTGRARSMCTAIALAVSELPSSWLRGWPTGSTPGAGSRSCGSSGGRCRRYCRCGGTGEFFSASQRPLRNRPSARPIRPRCGTPLGSRGPSYRRNAVLATRGASWTS